MSEVCFDFEDSTPLSNPPEQKVEISDHEYAHGKPTHLELSLPFVVQLFCFAGRKWEQFTILYGTSCSKWSKRPSLRELSPWFLCASVSFGT